MPHRLERVSWWGSSPKDEGTSHPCPSLPPLHYCTVHWFTTKGSNKLLSGAAPPTSVSIAVALLVTQKKTLLHGLQPLLLYLVSLFLLWQRIEGQQILTPTSNVASVSSPPPPPYASLDWSVCFSKSKDVILHVGSRLSLLRVSSWSSIPETVVIVICFF